MYYREHEYEVGNFMESFPSLSELFQCPDIRRCGEDESEDHRPKSSNEPEGRIREKNIQISPISSQKESIMHNNEHSHQNPELLAEWHEFGEESYSRHSRKRREDEND